MITLPAPALHVVDMSCWIHRFHHVPGGPAGERAAGLVEAIIEHQAPVAEVKGTDVSKYLSLREAAVVLSTTHSALQKRCVRNTRVVGGRVEAELGAGIVAHKIGKIWRVVFPADTLPAA